MHSLESRFTSLLTTLGLPLGLIPGLYQDLHAHYADPHRHYHNLAHIAHLLTLLDGTKSHTPELELAIWFHDIIYDPKSSDNEAQSALFFTQKFNHLVHPGLIKNTARLILATDPSRPRTKAPDELLLVDLDLSILGAAPDDYLTYTKAIRQEYLHVPDADFAAGRTKILQRFLTGPIYHTNHFTHLEEPARRNLNDEIATLSAQLP